MSEFTPIDKAPTLPTPERAPRVQDVKTAPTLPTLEDAPKLPMVDERAARDVARSKGPRPLAGSFRSLESFTGPKAKPEPLGMALIASVKGQSAEVLAEGRGDRVNSLTPWAFVGDKGEVA